MNARFTVEPDNLTSNEEKGRKQEGKKKGRGNKKKKEEGRWKYREKEKEGGEKKK